MASANVDVVVVGAGAAGLTAAIALSRAGFTVATVEAAAYAGAENWSGCVYFAENLAHPDVLGPDGAAGLAWERRLVERGFFACDGHSLLGMTYRDPDAFRHCYTVLRPVYDHHLSQIALKQGVALLTATTAESLIREGGRVIGVCTQRGPLYADLVFLAEGDASHLVTREGYERIANHGEKPTFLQGIKQVIDLPPGAVEAIFGVGPEEGIAYEMLLRNGTLAGRSVRLNMGGFVYANRQSLSVGLVLPADNLHAHFAGDPNLLMEWFEGLPALRPWLRNGKRGVFGAKLIRSGGAKEIPTLIDDGLAIGGAASAIGIDFPYPNFTGPATVMGLLLAQAARRIRAEGGGFTRDALRRHYLEPLQRTHYWRDVEFLRHWPGYVKKTRVFFDRNIDLALGTAFIWTRPDRGVLAKWTNWVRMLRHTAGPGEWATLLADLRHLRKALRLREVVSRPGIWRLLLDGTVNALRDLGRAPRANLTAAGTVRLHYTVADGTEPAAPPRALARWFNRFAPVLASAARRVYCNDDMPLSTKLPAAVQLLSRQVNLLDLLAAGGVALAACVTGVLIVGWDRLRQALRRGPARTGVGWYDHYAAAVRQAVDLTPCAAPAAQRWEARLAQLAYEPTKDSHIHVLWPRAIPDKNAIAKEGLWHVCPAHVYEARVSPLGQLQVVVNFENCIKCETCWRTSDLVDWARDGRHCFAYSVATPAASRLLAAVHDAGLARPTLPLLKDRVASVPRNIQPNAGLVELASLMEKLEAKLSEFDAALADEPRTVGRARSEYLESVARYAQQLAIRALDVARNLDDSLSERQSLLERIAALLGKAEQRAQRAADQRFAWAAADGRQIRYHDLARVRPLLGNRTADTAADSDPTRRWLRAEDDEAAAAVKLADWRGRLDAVFSPYAWRDLDRQVPLTKEQDVVLRGLMAEMPSSDLTPHPPLRKALLAELGRRDASLAYRVACHLWARDLARLVPGDSVLHQAAERWARGESWAAFGVVEMPQGEALFVPAGHARELLLFVGDRLHLVSRDDPNIHVEPLATLGLRGASIACVRLGDPSLQSNASLDRDQLLRTWNILSAADLISIAFGMADQLCQRAINHAMSRVQFPGLFHDEQARDAVGKFGAVKKMIAEMAARRYLLQTLDHTLSPDDFSEAAAVRTGLVKALAASALGTAPGSVCYNAGQVFGGTGFSEDDLLAKFYRDAAAWRFLGPDNADVYRCRGATLLAAWGNGDPLTALPEEAQLFDQLAQRRALQAELDAIRVDRARLRGLVAEWQKAPHDEAQVAELLARQDAYLLAEKALLLRTHARLEFGLGAETETALLRVWLEDGTSALEEFAAAVQAPPKISSHAGAASAVTHYADYLAAPVTYDSGEFLGTAVDLTHPRLVPEMIEVDPVVAEKNESLRKLFAATFGKARGGLHYERHVEKQHRPDAADLDFCRRHGFFRMPIPPELGGEGRSKLEYYLVTFWAQRLADVAVSLTIQVNTSLGTTPILLARDKDLPKAQKELAPFASEPSLQQEIQTGLEKLVCLLDAGDAKHAEQSYRELQKRLEETVYSRTAVKVLAHRFAASWQQAGRAGKAFDLAGMRVHLQDALTHWKEACGQAEEAYAEIGRRRAACDLYLRWIASGQISAFALTEPSAGSDTARVATRAKLRCVPVEVEPDGVLRFVPEGGKEPRYLLDAHRLEFRPDGVFYRWSPNAEPAPIRFDEYDYETDNPSKSRYYDHGSRRVYFTDICQLRARDGRSWYDYWELTGAKMWITNGRVCGVLCLYAKTEEGVTGFLVDRHAEGLIVGKDEDKLGQCGSPTNELALQAVRVPRENVLGLEGRGQVNALETLNVGRAGLAVTAMAQMAGLIDGSRAFAQAAWGVVPDWVAWRLGRMEADCFIAEALAFETVGRFEHKGTRSVRLESAVSKMLVSELLHRVIETAEEVHGRAGQTQAYLVEKRKRDARVLTIYEGTNEIQRFFILKDLASEVAPRWAGKIVPPPVVPSRESLELEALKTDFRQRFTAALDFLGQELWQNPNLQANCFLLAEAAAWLKAADSVLGRLAWLERFKADAVPALPYRAFAACRAEARARLRRFDEELARLRHGTYAPAVQAASLLFDRAAETAPTPAMSSEVTQPIAVLVVVGPTAAEVPQPHVENGRLLEAHYSLAAADRAALEMALRLRDAAGALVTIHVAAVGPRGAGQALREVLSHGVDQVRLVVTEHDAVAPDRAAAALAAVYKGMNFDLLLGGGADGDDGTLASRAAAALGVPFAGQAARLAIRGNELLLQAADGQRRMRALPAAVALEGELALRPFTIQGYLNGLAGNVEAIPWPTGLVARDVFFLSGNQAASMHTGDEPTRLLSPAEAALRLLDEAGLGRQGFAPLKSYEGSIEDVAAPGLLRATAVAVVAADPGGRLEPLADAVLRAAQTLASDTVVLLLGPASEPAQRQAVGQVLDAGCSKIILLTLPASETSAEMQSAFLQDSWPALSLTPRAVVGGPWAEWAFAALGRDDEVVALRVKRLTTEGDRVLVETEQAGGKLRARQTLQRFPGSTWWITLATGAEIEAMPRMGTETPRVQRWVARPRPASGRGDMQQLLGELQREAGITRLADADFIVDVGYGVGNRDGFEAVIEPLLDALRRLGVRGLAVGGSRKVTEELHLLPADRQIGQSGVRVNPQVLLAIGVSGAPQHLNYIGPRTTVLAFNRDPEAPLLTLNQRQARPRVFPVVGDLFETVPALTAALRQASPT